MYAGLNAVIYNAFETERGGVCGDDIAYQKMERERERREEWRLPRDLSIMDNKQAAQLTHST